MIVFLVAATVALGGGRPVVSVAPDDAGVRATVLSIAAKSEIAFDEVAPRARHEIDVTLLLEADARCPAMHVVEARISSAIDEAESESVPAGEGGAAASRVEVERAFGDWIFSGGGAATAVPVLSARAPGLAPRALVSLRGFADAIVASTLVARPIEPKPAREPIEAAPGVSLLVTRCDLGETEATIAYEARIRRTRDGLEPVFVGIGLRDAGGRLLQVIRPTECVDLRDELVRVAAETRFTPDLWRRTARFEALTLAGLRRVRVSVEARDLPLAR